MTTDDHAREVAHRMTLAEAASLTSGADFWTTQPLAEFDIDAVMVTDGPHGLRKQQADSSSITLAGAIPATCFPTAVALASTWNEDLLHEVGAALGAETRAEGVGVLLGPGVNIQRHPLGGRNFEYFSEDPLISGTLGAAMVRGVQSRGVGASVKHLVCNEQETGRTTMSSDVDERALREIYLAPFEHIVRTAQPWTVMTANNRLNGVYCSEHHLLLEDILRGEWGFEGVVISDWGSVYNRVAALDAGLDLEMPANRHADAEVQAAVQDGTLAEARLRASAERMIVLAERTREARRAPDVADLDAHHRLAHRAAAQAAVLLTNDGVLPLEPAQGARVAVLGDFARHPRYQGAGSSQVTPTRLDDLVTSLRERWADDVEIDWQPGYADGDAAAELRQNAVAAARAADHVILAVGLPDGAEAEGADRPDFALPADQLQLINDVTAVQPHTIIVISNGSPVDLAWIDRAGAVVEGWLGGQAGGAALADVLSGAISPSGKLAQSIPHRLSDNPAHIGWPGEARHVRYGEGIFVGYRYYDTYEREVAFPFGHGLSYTRFEYSATAEVDSDGGITARVTVRNAGGRQGREIVQVYARHGHADVQRPVHELVGFASVELAVGEESCVDVRVSPRQLSYWSTVAGTWVVPAGAMTLEIGASSRDIRVDVPLVLPGNGVRVPLNEYDTLSEWLADPIGGALLRAEWGLADGAPLPPPLDDDHVLKLVGTTTMAKFAYFDMGIDRAAVDRLLAAAATEHP